MNDTDMQAMDLRLELIQTAMIAVAGAMPRDAAARAARSLRLAAIQQFSATEMPEPVDEQLVACLAPLLTALESAPRPRAPVHTAVRTASTRPAHTFIRTTSRTFTGGVRPGHRVQRLRSSP